MWYKKEDADGDRMERDNIVFELVREIVGLSWLGEPSGLAILGDV